MEEVAGSLAHVMLLSVQIKLVPGILAYHFIYIYDTSKEINCVLKLLIKIVDSFTVAQIPPPPSSHTSKLTKTHTHTGACRDLHAEKIPR